MSTINCRASVTHLCSCRYDICSEEVNCELMGLAHVAAACDSTKAACINEDNGLLLGIVIAHEVGHVYCPYVLITYMRSHVRCPQERARE